MIDSKIITHVPSDAEYLMVNKEAIREFGLIAACVLFTYIEKYKFYEKTVPDFTGLFYMRNEEVMRHLQISKPTLRARKLRLLKRRVIRFTMVGMPAKQYIKINFKRLERLGVLGTSGVATMSSPKVDTFSAPLEKEERKKEERKKEAKKERRKKESRKKSFSRAGNILGNLVGRIPFKVFWDLYDKKIKKSKAEMLWDTLTGEEQKEVVEILPKWKLVYGKVKRFQPAPTTFLEDRRWEDDLSADAEDTDEVLDMDLWLQRYNTPVVDLLKSCHQRALSFCTDSDTSGLLPNICRLHDWIENTRPADAMTKTNHSEDIGSPAMLVKEYVSWLENSEWINNKPVSVFKHTAKLFSNFLMEYGKQIGLNPITGNYN